MKKIIIIICVLCLCGCTNSKKADYNYKNEEQIEKEILINLSKWEKEEYARWWSVSTNLLIKKF